LEAKDEAGRLAIAAVGVALAVGLVPVNSAGASSSTFLELPGGVLHVVSTPSGKFTDRVSPGDPCGPVASPNPPPVSPNPNCVLFDGAGGG
jgi:hypothetical protein